MNTCHFCGPTEAELTKEELWPKWFSRFLRENGVKKYSATRMFSDKTLKEWRPNTLDMNIHGVCVPCNNEVLSDLENEYFKPLLTKTVKKNTVSLSTEDQATLIAWITRFSMVADLIYAGDKGTFFSADDRKVFIDTFLPPPDTWIWLSSMYSTFPAGCSHSKLYFSDKSTGMVCTGIAGRLVFQFLLRRWNEPRPSDAFIHDTMRNILTRFKDATLQLCPTVNDGQALHWPPRMYFEKQSFQALANRWGGNTLGPR